MMGDIIDNTAHIYPFGKLFLFKDSNMKNPLVLFGFSISCVLGEASPKS